MGLKFRVDDNFVWSYPHILLFKGMGELETLNDVLLLHSQALGQIWKKRRRAKELLVCRIERDLIFEGLTISSEYEKDLMRVFRDYSLDLTNLNVKQLKSTVSDATIPNQVSYCSKPL